MAWRRIRIAQPKFFFCPGGGVETHRKTPRIERWGRFGTLVKLHLESPWNQVILRRWVLGLLLSGRKCC
ncbi:Succinate/fumarate transporter [Fusarium oxysporum f. sp. albedinis]|nr:Succinate/fumarate transporter [Fusarium oxysporum f. sp. albedinis]